MRRVHWETPKKSNTDEMTTCCDLIDSLWRKRRENVRDRDVDVQGGDGAPDIVSKRLSALDTPQMAVNEITPHEQSTD